ncbi:MAG TPA: carboxypeptidase-like regulatory domain-containing protein [Pyrinomonadaceae bacterium]|nr:carboxypeptidase-like regulatory domain-containing protein [Pyrinomonadaceae bacterium]
MDAEQRRAGVRFLTDGWFVVASHDNVTGILDVHMKLMRSSAAVALLLMFSCASLAQDKSNATIKGKVRVERGSPAGVAIIVLQGEREVARTTSDKKGDFVVTRVPPGTYSLKFRKAGLAVGTIDDVSVKAGQTRTLGDKLYLTIDEGSIVFIRGSVFSDGGRSVAGVKVELARVISDNAIQKLDSRVTGETGEFVFRLPPDPAKYRLTLKAGDSEPSSKDVEVETAAVYRVALTYKKKS